MSFLISPVGIGLNPKGTEKFRRAFHREEETPPEFAPCRIGVGNSSTSDPYLAAMGERPLGDFS